MITPRLGSKRFLATAALVLTASACSSLSDENIVVAPNPAPAEGVETSLAFVDDSTAASIIDEGSRFTLSLPNQTFECGKGEQPIVNIVGAQPNEELSFAPAPPTDGIEFPSATADAEGIYTMNWACPEGWDKATVTIQVTGLQTDHQSTFTVATKVAEAPIAEAEQPATEPPPAEAGAPTDSTTAETAAP